MNQLPWKEARSVYANAGPSVPVEFEIEGIGFRVRPTNDRGIDTGRLRYQVECVVCDCILHEATTGPSSYVRGHMKENHNFKGEITYAD